MKSRSDRIWDVHIHSYPDWVLENYAEWGRSVGERHWTNLVTNGPQGWAGIEQLLREMDRAGVERCVLQGWYWEKAETCFEQNRWHAKWIKAHGDRLSAFACMHPEMGKIVDELERATDWGAIGVGELLPQVQNKGGWDHPEWKNMLIWTSEHGWPVLLHVTETVGDEYPGRVETPLTELVELFETYSAQKWILAHWGGGLPFFALNKRVKKALKNCYFDTAAGPLIYDERIWSIAIQLVGAKKILFGSDFPLLIKPSLQKHAEMKTMIELLKTSGISASEIEAISHENARNLFSSAN